MRSTQKREHVAPYARDRSQLLGLIPTSPAWIRTVEYSVAFGSKSSKNWRHYLNAVAQHLHPTWTCPCLWQGLESSQLHPIERSMYSMSDFHTIGHLMLMCSALAVRDVLSGSMSSFTAERTLGETRACMRRVSRTTMSRYGRALSSSIVGLFVSTVRSSSRSFPQIM
jgi:hypothetical protein